jgi:hypothetical protein
MAGGLGYRSRTPEEDRGPTDLNEMVMRTGGELIMPFGIGDYVDAKAAERISAALNAFHHNMVHANLMEVELPGPPSGKRSWELKPSAENKKRWKDVRIICFGCPQRVLFEVTVNHFLGKRICNDSPTIGE